MQKEEVGLEGGEKIKTNFATQGEDHNQTVRCAPSQEASGFEDR